MHLSVRLILGSLAVLGVSQVGPIVGQESRDFLGWTASTEASPLLDEAPVQVANYQSQASLTDGLPPFPDLPQGSPSTNGNSGAVLPANLPQLDQAPAILPGTPAALPSNPSIPSAGEFAAQAVDQGSVLPPQPERRLPPQQQTSVVPAQQVVPVQQRVVPPPQQPVQQRTPVSGNNQLRPVGSAQPRFENAAYQNNSAPTGVAGQSSGGLRPVKEGPQTTGAGQRGAIDPRTVTTGLPYVTPPPRGRYPTSYYNPALFQNAAYYRQLAARQNGSSDLRPVGQLASNSTAVPNTQAPANPVLPQYSQPGIYPTAYQQCTTQINAAPTLPQPPMMPQTGAVPGSVIPPTLPANMTPGLYAPNNSGYVPLFSLGQENYNVVLGRGLIGQPTVYVPGQPFRNFFRYLSP